MVSSHDGPPTGYLARPRSDAGPGVLVLHSWWGLNAFFRDLCDRLAREGLVAFAPDLYAGQVATTVAEAKALRGKMNRQRAEAGLLDATRYLQQLPEVAGPGLGLLGFSWGAYLGLGLAVAEPQAFQAVVVFYGVRGGDYARSSAAFLGHFAETDDYVSASGVRSFEKALDKAGRPATFHTYPGTHHWFFEADRAEAYDAPSAALAWQRTVEFLHSTLGLGAK